MWKDLFGLPNTTSKGGGLAAVRATSPPLSSGWITAFPSKIGATAWLALDAVSLSVAGGVVGISAGGGGCGVLGGLGVDSTTSHNWASPSKSIMRSRPKFMVCSRALPFKVVNRLRGVYPVTKRWNVRISRSLRNEYSNDFGLRLMNDFDLQVTEAFHRFDTSVLVSTKYSRQTTSLLRSMVWCSDRELASRRTRSLVRSMV